MKSARDHLDDDIRELGHQDDEHAKGLGLFHWEVGELRKQIAHVQHKFMAVQHSVLKFEVFSIDNSRYYMTISSR